MNDALWIALGIFFLLDLLLAAIRSSVVNSRVLVLLGLREQKLPGAERAIALLEKPRLRVSIRLATALSHFTLSGLGLSLFLRAYGVSLESGEMPAGLLLSLVGLFFSGALLLLLEYAVEGRVLLHAELWAVRLAPLSAALDFLLTPLSFLTLALLGYPGRVQPGLLPTTEDDLRTWVEEDQPEGGLEKDEREMIYSIFQFGDTLAREIMVPRIDVLAIETNTTLGDAKQELARSGHSRVPVFEETVDNIVGLLYAKDLLLVGRDDEPLAAMRELLRPAYFVPEAKKADDLLAEMQVQRVHMAIVVDEYGGVAGLVTLEDIVEEIIGEVQDEYDQSEEMLYQQVGPDEYVFQGRIDLDDFNEVMGVHLQKESADTLGGFIYGQMGRVPVGGERVESGDVLLTVEQVSGRRIRKVRARRVQPASEVKVEKSDADR